MIVVVFATSTPIFLNMYSTDSIDPIIPFFLRRYVTPLRKDPPQIRTPDVQTGIISSGSTPYPNAPRQPRFEIVNQKPVYFPGDSIRVRNRFSTIEDPQYAVLNLNVSIYLHKEGYSSLTDPSHWFRNETTNFTAPLPMVPISDQASEGWIDFTFLIPSISELTSYGIASGDNVTIYQYCQPNKTKFLEGLDPIAFADNFTLSAFTLVGAKGTGFVNNFTGDNTFRQGENATAIIRVFSGSDNLSNVPITATLYDSSNTPIANNTSGISYYLTNSSGTTQTYTDGNGELRLVVNTSYPTVPQDTYYFNVTADLFGTGYFSRFYDPGTPSVNIAFNTTDFNFTVQNEMDTIDLQLISAVPQPLDPPNQNITIVTFRVRALYVYGIPGTYYYPQNMPVNAILNSNPAGVTLSIAKGFTSNGSTDWALTNSSGYVAFNITASFPTLYLDDIIKNITGRVNLQNDITPQYPYHTAPSPQPHRFMRNATNGVNASWTETISIIPDFWVGNIYLASIDTTTIRPGDSVKLAFEVNSTQAPGVDFAGVPVNVSLNQPIPGVSLSSPNLEAYPNYHETNGTGHYELLISTIYLLTPEVVQSIILDLIVDFENDSEVRWIGTQNAGTASLVEFNTTWRTAQSSVVTIHPQFTNFSVSLDTTNETGDTTIRSGDGLTLTFKVQEEGGGPILADVPVNVSLASAYAGVSLNTIISGGPHPNPGYFNTTGAGIITVELSTTYGTTPKNLDIFLQVTADFENDSSLNSVWYIGQKPIGVNFKSNSSFSDLTTPVRVRPQYFTGEIYVAGGPNPNATLIQQKETIRIEFRLRLDYAGINYASSITGVNISIQINNSDPVAWAMRVLNVTLLPALSQDSVASLVVFYIQTNVTGTTPEADYNITATADFLAAKGLTYNVTHATVPTGKLLGTWVNGSTTEDNSSVTQMFRVENIDRINIQVESLSDLSHTDEGFNASSGFYEVYRDTTSITLNGTYEDATGQGRSSTLILAYNYTGGSNPYDLTSVTSNAQGFFSTTIILNSTVPLADLTIYGRDTVTRTPQEIRIGLSSIRVMTTVVFSGHSRSGTYNGTAVYVGETVSVSGTLLDEQGVTINSGELVNRLRLIGWNATNKVEIGTPVTGSPIAGIYGLTYQIPSNFLGDILFIRLNLTMSAALLHYRVNYVEFSVPIYRDFQVSNLEMFFPSTGGTLSVTNGSVYLITGIQNRTFLISGTLQDSISRSLVDKEINDRLGAVGRRRAVTSIGFFNLQYNFTGWNNATFVWTLHHLTDAGTNLTTHYNLTLQWEIYDTTSPSITVTSPTGFDNVSTLANTASTRINATIFDPDFTTSPGYVSLGLDAASITIMINSSVPVSAPMVSVGGNDYSYVWDTSSSADEIYNITIIALDNAGNERRLVTFVVVDLIQPTATLNIPVSGSPPYVTVDLEGNAVITGTITDNPSVGGRQSGINETSIAFRIQDINSGTTILTKDSVSIGFISASGDYSYNWTIIFTSNQTRNSQFTVSEDWNIILDYEDLAGNAQTTQQSIKLDNTPPSLGIVEAPPTVIINDTVEFTISFADPGGSGIDANSLRVYLISAATSQTFQVIPPSLTTTPLTNDQYGISLVISSLPNGVYAWNVTGVDRTGNLGMLSGQFLINRPITTTPTNTTTTGPPAGPLLGPLDIIQFILFDLVALGVGVGLAVVYERLKVVRRREQS